MPCCAAVISLTHLLLLCIPLSVIIVLHSSSTRHDDAQLRRRRIESPNQRSRGEQWLNRIKSERRVVDVVSFISMHPSNRRTPHPAAGSRGRVVRTQWRVGLVQNKNNGREKLDVGKFSLGINSLPSLQSDSSTIGECHARVRNRTYLVPLASPRAWTRIETREEKQTVTRRSKRSRCRRRNAIYPWKSEWEMKSSFPDMVPSSSVSFFTKNKFFSSSPIVSPLALLICVSIMTNQCLNSGLMGARNRFLISLKIKRTKERQKWKSVDLDRRNWKVHKIKRTETNFLLLKCDFHCCPPYLPTHWNCTNKIRSLLTYSEYISPTTTQVNESGGGGIVVCNSIVISI